MIIVLRPEATPQSRADLESRIGALGISVRLSPGATRDVLLVSEGGRTSQVAAAVLGHPAIERLVPVAAASAGNQRIGRRSFLDVFLSVTLGLLMIACGVVAAAVSLNPGRRRGRRDIVPAGTMEDFDRRSYRVVESEGAAILVVRTASREYRALSAICTHSEICQVEWDARREQVICPCHRAAFDVFGNVLHGPPPRPLRTYPVAVVDGRIWVRTNA